MCCYVKMINVLCSLLTLNQIVLIFFRHHHAELISSEDSNNDDVDTVRCGKRIKLEQNKSICQSSYVNTNTGLENNP